MRKTSVESDFDAQKQKAIDEIWKIKKTYTGGDRVLEYCLEGLKGKKENLFKYLLLIEKPESETEKTVAMLQNEVKALKGEAAHSQPELPKLQFSAHDVKSDPIHGKAIAGNDYSVVAGLIEKLGTSD